MITTAVGLAYSVVLRYEMQSSEANEKGFTTATLHVGFAVVESKDQQMLVYFEK